MAKYVLIKLTLAEAEGLSFAAGNSTNDPDFMRDYFPYKADRDATWRAHNKLNDAIRAAGGFKPRKKKEEQKA